MSSSNKASSSATPNPLSPDIAPLAHILIALSARPSICRGLQRFLASVGIRGCTNRANKLGQPNMIKTAVATEK